MVAHDGVPTGQAAHAGGVVKGAEQGAGGSHLKVCPALEAGGHPAGKVAEDLAVGLVEPEMTRSASEALPSKVTEQFGDERGRRGHWPTDGIADPDHT